MRENLHVLHVITSIQSMITTTTTFCQASTLSSEEMTKIKRVFFLFVFFNSKTLLELSAFAIKQTFNM